jgi:enamine deaminase RidA (YjgF/YER057c/UK114 family)
MSTLATLQDFQTGIDPRVADALPCAREQTYSEAARAGESPSAVLRRLADRLLADHATPVGVMVFSSLSAQPVINAALQAELGTATWPVLWIEGAACADTPLAGVQVFALIGAPVSPIRLDGRVVASHYSIGGNELCWVGASLPDDIHAERGVQTTQAFRNLERSLQAAGFGLADVMRTWCYNHELLAWYDVFNRARSALYGQIHFRTGAAPASTGISAANPAGAALVLAGLACRPAIPGKGARPVGSPLQCPAPAYGSAFSRAMEIDLGSRRRLLVSGTASIAPGGESVHLDDPAAQVELTMRVVAAILESRGMDWSHVTRGLAYFKSPGYERYLARWCTENGWLNPPCIALHCDICRDDLLFEIEVDAEA